MPVEGLTRAWPPTFVPSGRQGSAPTRWRQRIHQPHSGSASREACSPWWRTSLTARTVN